MDEIKLFEQLYGKTDRLIMVFSKKFELLWHNRPFFSDNLASNNFFAISSRLSGNDFSRFDFSFEGFKGVCEAHFCESILNGIYIIEFFESKDSDNSMRLNALRFTMREGVTKIISSIHLLYEKLEDNLDKDNIAYLNSAMLGCYDIHRNVILSADGWTDDVDCGEWGIVDFSRIASEFVDEVNEIAHKLPITVEADIDVGIFVECECQMLYGVMARLLQKICRESPNVCLKVSLKMVEEEAVFAIESRKNRKKCENISLRRNSECVNLDAIVNRYIEKFLNKTLGRIFEDKKNNSKINGFCMPVCRVMALPLRSPQLHYKGDRFSKCRVLLSEIYDIKYFDTPKEDIVTVSE